MSWFYSKGIGIKGVAAAVPKNQLNVESLTQRFDPTFIHKFVMSTGITSCHQTEEGQTASDLGFAAAEHLLNGLSIDRTKIGILIFVSTSPDYRKPATSCVLQKRLQLPTECACMDLVHGCAGFVYGHQTMSAMMAASECVYGLLILGETTSKVINKQDRNSMMFGDAGAAVVYERKPNEESVTLLRADGKRYKSLIVPAGGFRDPHPEQEYYTSEDGEIRSKYHLYMDGMDIFNFSINDVCSSIQDYLNHIDKTAEDFDIFASHQANNYIIQRIAKKLHFSKEKVPICLDRYGNTSSVSIPLLLSDYYGIKKGGTQRVLASGFGIGLAWGVTSFYLDPDCVLPVIETNERYDEGIIR